MKTFFPSFFVHLLVQLTFGPFFAIEVFHNGIIPHNGGINKCMKEVRRSMDN